MKVEALQPLLVRLPDGDLHLQPGFPVDLPQEQATRLLTKAYGKVRVVPDPLTAGMIIEWDSPVFGLLRPGLLVHRRVLPSWTNQCGSRQRSLGQELE